MLVGVLKTCINIDYINSAPPPPKCDFFETYVSCRRTLRHQNDLFCEVIRIFMSLFPWIVFLSWIKSCLWKLLLQCTLVKFQGRYTLQIATRPCRLKMNTVLQSHNGQYINLLIESEVRIIVPPINTVYFFNSLMCVTSEKFKLVTEDPFHAMNKGAKCFSVNGNDSSDTWISLVTCYNANTSDRLACSLCCCLSNISYALLLGIHKYFMSEPFFSVYALFLEFDI